MEIISLKALPANCVLCDFFCTLLFVFYYCIVKFAFLCMNKIIVGVVVVFFVTVFFYFSVEYFRTF